MMRHNPNMIRIVVVTLTLAVASAADAKIDSCTITGDPHIKTVT
jgi:hypothetical protein